MHVELGSSGRRMRRQTYPPPHQADASADSGLASFAFCLVDYVAGVMSASAPIASWPRFDVLRNLAEDDDR